MDTRALMQNFDATAASLGQNWFQDSRSLMMDASANAASQMMPGASAPGVMAGAPIVSAGMQLGFTPGSHKVKRGKMEFGGAFANGGIAPGGKVSLVGERGPEFIVPSGPTAVVPMGQMPTRAAPLRDTGSTMDRHMSTGLSGMPTRPVGRSINDPERAMGIAMRRARSQGDYEGAARMARLNAWSANQPGFTPMGAVPGAAQPATPPQMPSRPAGRWVAGRSAGSQVWQPNAPVIDVPSEPIPMPSFGTGSSAPPQPLAPLPLPPLEGNNPLTGLPLASLNSPSMMPEGWNAMNRGNAAAGLPLPPTGLYGPESPPMISSLPIPGTDQMMPMIGGVPKGTPVAKTQPKPAAEWQPPKMYDETIPEKRDAQGNLISAATTRQYYYVQDPQTGKPRKEYALDANGDGVPDNQQPGWMSWLEAQK